MTLIRMQAEIRERKSEMPKSSLNGFSGRFNHPSKIATDEVAIQKVKREAKYARAKIPPDMQVRPYYNSSAKPSKLVSKLSNGFMTAKDPVGEKSPIEMKAAFRAAAKQQSADLKYTPKPNL